METGFDSRTQRLGDPVICTQLYFCGGASDEHIERIMRQGFTKEGTATFACYFVTVVLTVTQHHVTGALFPTGVHSSKLCITQVTILNLKDYSYIRLWTGSKDPRSRI